MTLRRFLAPGRVNLIGEHTDYNLGFVLPMALDLVCVVESQPSPDGRFQVCSELRPDPREWLLADLASAGKKGHWSDYVVGVARELQRAGVRIEPKHLLIRSTVPEGAGLSSSAALEVASALALLDGQPVDRLELAQLCRRAEVEYVGMPCGIMDQYVAVFGEANAALKIDCRSLEHKAVPLPGRIGIYVVHSMVKHELAQSAYRERTQECAAALAAIRRHLPHVRSLREIDSDQLRQLAPHIPALPARRARHVVSENERVELFVSACRKGDLERMGQLLVDSHHSLQRDYEVSCEELDFLVDAALSIEGVFGARMTGAGFGGCTVNLVAEGAGPEFEFGITRKYERWFGAPPAVYQCRPSAGAREL